VASLSGRCQARPSATPETAGPLLQGPVRRRRHVHRGPSQNCVTFPGTSLRLPLGLRQWPPRRRRSRERSSGLAEAFCSSLAPSPRAVTMPHNLRTPQQMQPPPTQAGVTSERWMRRQIPLFPKASALRTWRGGQRFRRSTQPANCSWRALRKSKRSPRRSCLATTANPNVANWHFRTSRIPAVLTSRRLLSNRKGIPSFFPIRIQLLRRSADEHSESVPQTRKWFEAPFNATTSAART